MSLSKAKRKVLPGICQQVVVCLFVCAHWCLFLCMCKSLPGHGVKHVQSALVLSQENG